MEFGYVKNVFFIHNILSDYYKSLLDYFSNYYSRFNYKIISTYDKAIQYIKNKQDQFGREIDKPNLPAIILDPTGELNISDSSGRQLRRFPKIMSGGAKLNNKAIYMDDDVIIYPGFVRLVGEINVILLLSSFYEYCDVRLLFLQQFSGTERYSNEMEFSSYIILPDEIVFYEYDNEITNVKHELDWFKFSVVKDVVKTINSEKFLYNVCIKPIIKLTGISDASEKYGGSDDISQWKLNLSFEYEIEIPWYLSLHINHLVKYVNFNINVDDISSISMSNYVPKERYQLVYSMNIYDLDDPFSRSMEIRSPSNQESTKNITLIDKQIYEVLKYDVDPNNEDLNLVINNQYKITDYNLVTIVFPERVLQPLTEFTIDNVNININRQTDVFKKLKENDIIEIYYYKEDI